MEECVDAFVPSINDFQSFVVWDVTEHHTSSLTVLFFFFFGGITVV
jgi:hypothetical protein